MGYICGIETNFFMSKFLDVMSLVDCQLVLFVFCHQNSYYISLRIFTFPHRFSSLEKTQILHMQKMVYNFVLTRRILKYQVYMKIYLPAHNGGKFGSNQARKSGPRHGHCFF